MVPLRLRRENDALASSNQFVAARNSDPVLFFLTPEFFEKKTEALQCVVSVGPLDS